MSATVPKALKEVRDWKESVYEDTKNMTTRERLEFIRREFSDMLEREGLEKVRLTERIYTLRRRDARPDIVAEGGEEYDAGENASKVG